MRTSAISACCVLVLALVGGLAVPALAVDGVLEINQTCAGTTGCFTGDTAGFPVTISAPGSYVLTGNLTVPDANTGGIEVGANAVTVDLNGFAILGPVTCSRGTGSTVCSGAGSGWGIRNAGASACATSFHSSTVKNGSLRGMGLGGVFLCGRGVRFEGVVATENGGRGIGMSAEAGLVTDCIASYNATDGLRADGGVVENSAAYGNGGSGIVGNGPIVVNNTASNNDSHGIVIFGHVISNHVRDNGGDGIRLNGGANSALSNVGVGNTGFGINFAFGAVGLYSENTVHGNTAGTVSGGTEPNPGLSNFCNGNTTCP